MDVLGLWLAYGAAAAMALWLARRYAGVVSGRAGTVLALLPLAFTGKAMILGRLYGPADLFFTADPWKSIAASAGVGAPRNPILSDLAFANLPWRAALQEAVANGRAPLWNRFVLGGNPLLGAAQAGVFHPSTWLGLWLPLPLSWTFSCAFTLFLALLSAYLFLRDFELGERAALVGALGWGFSTYVVFWVGWSVGPSTATFPLLLLGLRRLARAPGGGGLGLTAAALCLSLFGGHPESFFHTTAAGAAYFAWEFAAGGRRAAARALGGALAAGGLALLLSGPQLFPLLEVLPHSAEYRVRRAALASGAARQSVPPSEAAARLLPDLLPFAHGIYGKSPVDARREDGSGMALGYAGAVLFPLAVLAFAGRPRARGRVLFLAFFLAGLAYGASAPGLLDLTARLPGFALALNYRLVFLSGLGLAGLAALGTERLSEPGGPRRLAVAAAATAGVLVAAFLASQPVFADRGLEAVFVRREFLFEVLPVALLAMAAAGARRRPRVVADAAIAYLALQRFLEMGGTYPTLPAAALAPPLPTLAALPLGSDPSRIAAAGDVFRPNAAALYGVEDVRGYESLVLDRFADTFALWSRPQPASFNRVDDLARPFLRFLNVRYAIGAPGEAVPAGWVEQARGSELAIFANPGALPRAFVPRSLERVPDAVAAMASAADFGQAAFFEGAGDPGGPNGTATLRVREVGPDVVVEASVSSRALVATSLPDWPGWIAEEGRRRISTATVNHAFVGFWVEPGDHTVRLRYRPRSWALGLGAFLAGVLASVLLAARRRPRL
jgi:hypothetical protein